LARGLQLAGGDTERGRRAGVVEAGAVEQLGGDQARARVPARVLVAVGAGQDAGEHVAGVGAHEDHEHTLRVVSGPPLKLLGEEEPPPCAGGDGSPPIADRLQRHGGVSPKFPRVG